MLRTIGNPDSFNHLVPKPHEDDAEFHEILNQIDKGYKLKKMDWVNKRVDICDACEEVGYMHMRNSTRSQLTDSQKLDKIIDMLEEFDSRLTKIEEILDIYRRQNRASGENQEEQKDQEGEDLNQNEYCEEEVI